MGDPIDQWDVVELIGDLSILDISMNIHNLKNHLKQTLETGIITEETITIINWFNEEEYFSSIELPNDVAELKKFFDLE